MFDIFLRFWVFEAHFLIKRFLIKKTYICSKCNNGDEKTFKEEESMEILKIIGLIENNLLL